MTETRIGDARLICADVMDALRSLPDESVHTVVTSPPYWALRDYGTGTWEGGSAECEHKMPIPKGGTSTLTNWVGTSEAQEKYAEKLKGTWNYREVCGKCGARRIDQQIGLEASPEEYVARMVEVFREVRRVLRDDGTAWVNLGDSYAGSGRGPSKSLNKNNSHSHQAVLAMGAKMGSKHGDEGHTSGQTPPHGYKAKDLVGIPEQLALALRADGWYWRSRIPWIKRNCMPESCRDRPATAVEYVMMFSKSRRYYYDREAVKIGVVPGTLTDRVDTGRFQPKRGFPGATDNGNGRLGANPKGKRNRRNSDWFMESWQGLLTDEDGEPLAFVVNTKGYKGAHFATFPPKLVLPMILAGCPEGGTVLDPFGGSGTTAAVALEYGRKAILIDLKPEYIEMQKKRIRPVAGRPLLAFGGTA